MKCICALMLLFFSVGLTAQLTVKPTASGTDSFVYVQNQILFVEQGVNLEVNTNNPNTEASIYLRGQAQLIQGESNTENTGSGMLSVFQEGDTDQWDYNNWTSPVSANSTAPANGNGFFAANTIYNPTGKTSSDPVTFIDGFDSVQRNGSAPLQIPRYWFFWYPNSTEYAGFDQFGEDDSRVPAGYAFTMKGVTGEDNTVADDSTFDGRTNNTGSAQRYDFRGRPNSGTVPITFLEAGNNTYVGNPYPSSLDLSYFLLEHSQVAASSNLNMLNCTSESIPRKNLITGIAYFWDSDPTVQSHFLDDYQGGYEAFAPVDCSTPGITTPATFFRYESNGDVIAGSGVEQMGVTNRRFSPIAQGFFVEAVTTADGFENTETLAFQNRHRVFEQESGNPNSNFKRPGTFQEKNKEDDTDLVVIPKLRLNIEVDETYTRQLALGFWPTATTAVDGGMDAINFDDIATDAGFLHNDDAYIIDVRPFEVTEQIPLFLNVSEQADIKFTATSFENFDTETIFIYDSVTNSFYNVKNNSWSITLQPGNYNGRFFLTFEEDTVLDTQDFGEQNFDIFQNNAASQLEIRNPNGLGIKSVSIFDVTGKTVIRETNLEGQPLYTFSTSKFQDALYVVNIITAEDISFSKKISIINRN